LTFNSKLNNVDKNINLNLNLNQKCFSPTWRKPIPMVFNLWRTFKASSKAAKSCLKGYLLRNAGTFVNVVQHLRDFGRFEMNKRDLSRQREDSSQNPRALLPAVILINVWVGIVEHHLVDPCVLPPPHYVQNIAQEIFCRFDVIIINR
jgi:hypothetical protein